MILLLLLCFLLNPFLNRNKKLHIHLKCPPFKFFSLTFVSLFQPDHRHDTNTNERLRTLAVIECRLERPSRRPLRIQAERDHKRLRQWRLTIERRPVGAILRQWRLRWRLWRPKPGKLRRWPGLLERAANEWRTLVVQNRLHFQI